MRKIGFIFIALSLVVSIEAQDLSKINKMIDDYSRTELLAHAQWSICAKYLDSGKMLINYNAEQSVAPASGQKVFTSITALDKLGEDFQFQTKIYYDGEIVNTDLTGNLYIIGSGDPSLGSGQVESALPYDLLLTKIVDEIKKRGITRIEGSVIIDNSLYEYQPIPDHWEYIDIGNYYGASSTALSINDNLYYLFFEPASKVGDIARVIRTEPEIPGLEFTNFMKTGEKGSGDNGYIYCPPLQYNAYLQGSIPQGSKEFSIKGSIPDPPMFAAQVITEKLITEGVKVEGSPEKTSTPEIYRSDKLISIIESPPLKSIVYVLNKRSSNLYAELLLKAIAYSEKGVGNTNKGVQVIEEFLEDEGIATQGLHLYDGSGLSRANSITAKMMVDLLTVVTKKSYFNSFYNSLGVMGDPDDLGFFKFSGRGTALEKNARIKSGVIQGVRSYSGYLNDQSGKTIVFSLIANNFNGSGGTVSSIHQKIMNELAKLN